MAAGSRVLVCGRTRAVAVGVDPGQSTGAVAVVTTDDEGRPSVAGLWSWAKDRRKAATAALRTWRHDGEHWQPGDAFQRPDPILLNAAALAKWLEELEELEPVAAVEAIQWHGMARAGVLDLAAQAGASEALLRFQMQCDVQRPPERSWVKQVAGVERRTRKADTRKQIRACYEAAEGAAVHWRCRLPGATPDEHALDAIGLALYALQASTLAPQEKQ